MTGYSAMTMPTSLNRPDSEVFGSAPHGRVAILIAAHNEQDSIRQTLEAAVAQDYPLSAVVLMADNCTDRTVEIAESIPGVTVVLTHENRHKKSGALNQGWALFGPHVDFFACLDADTVIPPDSVRHWVAQMVAEPGTAGISARFTMQPKPENSAFENILARLQKSEFAQWTDTALSRGGRTTVLAGTACMLRVAALDSIHCERVTEGVHDGPWSYSSDVEDFELTYRLRRQGWETKVSYTVRAYTDAMVNLRALWAQRMKWQGGTVDDLLTIGVNCLTLRDWLQQAAGLLAAGVRLGWIVLTVTYAAVGILHVDLLWLLAPLLFVCNDVKKSLRVPHRDRRDVLLAALLLPQELFAWMRAGWFLASWMQCLAYRTVLPSLKKDRWAAQITAEAI